MNRIVLNSRISSDGVLHLNVPLGDDAADKDVQVTVEPVAPGLAPASPIMSAAELLSSELIGIWANRTDIGDSQAFARQLRERAQTRS